MSDYWNFYSLLVEDEPASIFVDLGIAGAVPMVDFPNMAYLRVQMRHPREDGLSSEDEYQALIGIENDISKLMESDNRSIYVGRNTSSGNRDFYFYTSDRSIESALSGIMQIWPDYDYETGTRADVEWNSYRQFLYPAPEDFQRMGNRDVIDRLLENGDNIDIHRIIDHFAVFKIEYNRDKFAQFLVNKGYNISEMTKTQNGEFQVAFERKDRPDQIDEVTIGLFRAALEHNGDYDGWGCVAVTERPV